MAKQRIKLLFVFDMEPALVPLWSDGLWAALQILKRSFDVEMFNMQEAVFPSRDPRDFVLGWGAFGSPVDKVIRKWPNSKVGLCIGGATPPVNEKEYDVLFYETHWYKQQFEHPRAVHAFGVNTDIYKPDEALKYGINSPVFDYLSVGSFSYWKRHSNILNKTGNRMVVGQIQKNNLPESMDIIANLVVGGVGVMDMVEPKKLMSLYNLASTVYVPAEIMGGGERAVLEARACGRHVEISEDNPKLLELLTCPVWDHHYYAHQLEIGIRQALNK